MKICEVEELILDRRPWYRDGLSLQRLSVGFRHKTFRGVWLNRHSSREPRFSSARCEFQEEREKIWKFNVRGLECWNRFCRMFVFYFNVVGEVLLGHVTSERGYFYIITSALFLFYHTLSSYKPFFKGKK